jgi:hypothetical protein
LGLLAYEQNNCIEWLSIEVGIKTNGSSSHPFIYIYDMVYATNLTSSRPKVEGMNLRGSNWISYGYYGMKGWLEETTGEFCTLSISVAFVTESVKGWVTM